MPQRRYSFGAPSASANVLRRADNLAVLDALPAGAIDLVYVDPPFATGTRRKGAQGLYDDRLPGGLGAYLADLTTRFQAMHRVLDVRGSLLVHLDYRAVHYAKVELDRIFGYGRLVNEIVWAYSVGGKSPRAFGRKHDTILWYAKGPDYCFDGNAVRIARKPGSHMRVRSDAEGRPVQVKRDRRTGRVYEYPVHEGKVPEDTWTDIETLNRSDAERTGWPTQKPEALLTRLVLAASRPGALVADFYSGSATTAAVCLSTGRRFLAVDASADAIAVGRERLVARSKLLAKAGSAPPDLIVAS